MNSITTLRHPVVFAREGEVFANSRDVAEFFDKQHGHVLRDIDNLTAQQPSLALRQFTPSTFSKSGDRNENNGLMPAPQTFRCFHMTRDGFTLLAMGFTGAKALAWKLKYLEAFNAMEAELRSPARDPMIMLNDPAAMRGLLLSYTEKVLALEADKAAMQPKVDALDRISTADGSLCITDAAKALGVKPKDLFIWLDRHGWTYRRQGGGPFLGYREREVAGDVEHKEDRHTRSDGTEKITVQVRITAKGLTRLAELMQSDAA